jgi:hypothetical protein
MWMGGGRGGGGRGAWWRGVMWCEGGLRHPLWSDLAHKQDVERRTRLVRSVAASKLLNGLIGTPRELQGDVQASALVGHTTVCVERDACGRRVGDDGNLHSVVESEVCRSFDFRWSEWVWVMWIRCTGCASLSGYASGLMCADCSVEIRAAIKNMRKWTTQHTSLSPD